MKKYSDYLKEEKEVRIPLEEAIKAAARMPLPKEKKEQLITISSVIFDILEHAGEAWAMKARGQEEDEEKQWGHAKDFTNILGSMLDEAGLKGTKTWKDYQFVKKNVEEEGLPEWIAPWLNSIVNDLIERL